MEKREASPTSRERATPNHVKYVKRVARRNGKVGQSSFQQLQGSAVGTALDMTLSKEQQQRMFNKGLKEGKREEGERKKQKPLTLKSEKKQKKE